MIRACGSLPQMQGWKRGSGVRCWMLTNTHIHKHTVHISQGPYIAFITRIICSCETSVFSFFCRICTQGLKIYIVLYDSLLSDWLESFYLNIVSPSYPEASDRYSKDHADKVRKLDAHMCFFPAVCKDELLVWGRTINHWKWNSCSSCTLPKLCYSK